MDEELEQALNEVEEELNNLPTIKPKRRKKTMAKKEAKETVEEETKPVRRKKEKVKSEEPTPKKKGKSKKGGESVPRGEGYTAAQLSEELGIEPSDLRRALRAIKAEKPGSSWVWPKKTDADLKSIRGELKTYLKEVSEKKVGRPRASGKKPAKAEKGKDKATKRSKKKS